MLKLTFLLPSDCIAMSIELFYLFLDYYNDHFLTKQNTTNFINCWGY